MTRALILLLLALAASGLAACTHPALAGNPASSTLTPAQVAGRATAEAIPPFDAQFIDAAVAHHQQAIELAKPALAQAEHEELRVFAYEIMADHNAVVRQMTAWRNAWYPDLPAPDASRAVGEAPNDNVKQATSTFDQRWLEAMSAHHEAAIEQAQAAQAQFEHPQLGHLMDAVLARGQAEIHQMQKWQAAWYEAREAIPSP